MDKNNTDVLFILKKRGQYGEDYEYGEYSYTPLSSGLFNSANFVNEMLLDKGICSNIVQVLDNNEIDKWVTFLKPKTVIIEALWVVPEKFDVLIKLHPDVKWVVRIHSELPFIANEGIAMDWLKRYKNVSIASNSKYFISAMKDILGDVHYLPNYYPINTKAHKPLLHKDGINIAIFGAIRPLKNTLTQTVAAINYAKSINKKLYLHINTGRIEQKGDNMLKNIRALFKNSENVLVEHKWLEHKKFLKLVSQMDLGLQVSLTETYNIISADFISQNIPIVTSTEVPFVNIFSKTRSTKNVNCIISTIRLTLRFKRLLTKINKLLLSRNSKKSEKVWLRYLR